MSDSAKRIALLSKVGSLAGTLEYDEVLAAAARLSIPEFADWCLVDMMGSGGDLRRVEVAHRDPSRGAVAEKLRSLTPPRLDPAMKGLLEGRPLFIPDYTDEVGIAHAWPAAHLALAREIRARSLLVIPLVVHGAVVGVSTFVMTAESGRRYAPEDLALGNELAARAAAVVENARLHQELKRSEQRFRLALAHTHVSVFETDRDLRYTWVYNPLYGLRADDLVGKTSDVIRSDEAAHYEARKRAVLESGEPSRDEIQVTVQGVTHHCLVHMEPRRDRSGEIVGITGVATDVTEQKQVQATLAEALAFRDRMLGILGHDLRNPASAVLMVASALLKAGDLAGRSRDGIVEIKRAAGRMLEMIATLLEFSEARFKGTLPISPAPTDLHELTRTVVQEVVAANPGHHVEVTVGGDGRGECDPARLAQVVTNLVANAITYGAPGEAVRVAVDGDEDELRLTVWNAGAPIAPELLPVLFDPFRRGTSDRRGLGLGLYIVKEIVAAHGGQIDVRSTAEGGTTFAARLPRWGATSRRRPAASG